MLLFVQLNVYLQLLNIIHLYSFIVITIYNSFIFRKCAYMRFILKK